MNDKAYMNLSGWERALSNAVMQECSCGGGGPDNAHTCPACKVYHRLVVRDYQGVFENEDAILPSAMFCSADDAARYQQTRPNPTVVARVTVTMRSGRRPTRHEET